MLHSITGLSLDQIQLTIYTLDLIRDYYRQQELLPEQSLEERENCSIKRQEIEDLSSSYIMLIDAIDSMLLLVINELFSTRSDIIYWDRMQKGSQWDLKLYQMNSYVYRLIFPYKDAKKIIIPINNKHDMIYHIESLKDDFNNLAVLLAKLHECIGMIREISTRIESLHLFKSKRDDFYAPTEGEGGNGLISIVEQIIEVNHQSRWELKINHIEQFTKQQLMKTISFFTSSLKEHLPVLLAINNADHPHFSSCSQAAGDILCSNPLLLPDPMTTTTTTMSSQEQPQPPLVTCRASELIEYSDQLSSFFREFIHHNANKDFPFELHSLTMKLHRPSYWERFWLRNLLLGLSGLVASRLLYLHYSDGSLSVMYHHFMEWLQAKLQDHLINPFQRLFNEIFHTIHHREHIVSQRDYEISRNALKNMLEDFSKSKQGMELLSKIKDQISQVNQVNIQTSQELIAKVRDQILTHPIIQEQILTNPKLKEQIVNNPIFQIIDNIGKNPSCSPPAPAPPTATNDDMTTTAAAPASAVTAAINTSTTKHTKVNPNTSSPSSPNKQPDSISEQGFEQGLEILMREYEHELQNPIKGLIWGKLLTAMLIQMQKLKVHMEAALLSMDQILNNNELTIAAIGTLPAVFIGGTALWGLYRLLIPVTQHHYDRATKHFQLILSDIERSLEELKDLQAATTAATAATTSSSLLPSTPSSSLLAMAAAGAQSTNNNPAIPSNTTAEHWMSPLALTRQSSFNSDPKQSAAIHGPHHHPRHPHQYWKVKGALAFHLIRFRNKFLSIFFDILRMNPSYRMNSMESFLWSSSPTTFVTYNHNLANSFNSSEKVHGSSPLPSDFDEDYPSAAGGDTTDYSSIYHLSERLSQKYQRRKIQRERQQEQQEQDRQRRQGQQQQEEKDAVSPRNHQGIFSFLHRTVNLCYRRVHESSWIFSHPIVYRYFPSIALLSHSLHRSFWMIYSSMTSFSSSFLSLLFGSNQLMSNTTIYDSLHKDIALLEGPDKEISLQRKLEITKRMRQSYRMLIPQP